MFDGFPVVIEWPVAWGDLDAFGHVNNTVYLRYFEHVRLEYFRRVGLDELMKSTGVGPILARTSCVFRRPLGYPDRVRIGTRVDNLGADRFTMIYRVVSDALGEVAAEGDGRIVMFDYRKNQKAALPTEVRQAMEDLA